MLFVQEALTSIKLPKDYTSEMVAYILVALTKAAESMSNVLTYCKTRAASNLKYTPEILIL